MIAGYNIQSVVDNKHHLVVTTEVTNEGNDSQQLYPMMAKAKKTLEVKRIIGLADTGYYEGNQLKKCEDGRARIIGRTSLWNMERLSRIHYHFLVRGFEKVRGEWSIVAMGYNFTQVLNIIGIKAFMNYCAMRKRSRENVAT